MPTTNVDKQDGERPVRPNRFVLDSIEGILIDGVSVEEYLKRPEVQKRIKEDKEEKDRAMEAAQEEPDQESEPFFR